MNLSNEKVEEIARTFCFFEDIDPDELIDYCRPHQAKPVEVTPGVFCTPAVHVIPTKVPRWQTLIPEIQRTYNMLKAFGSNGVQI